MQKELVAALRIDVTSEHKGQTEWAVFIERLDGQWELIGTREVGPFDTLMETMLWALRAVADSGHLLVQ